MTSIDVTRSQVLADTIADAGGAPSSVLATKARLYGLAALGADTGIELAALFDDNGPTPEMKARRVRTASGAARYGQPIGSIIVRDPTARSGGKRGSGGSSRGGSGGARQLRQSSGRGGSGRDNSSNRSGGKRRGRGGGGGGGDQILEGLGGLAGLAALMGGLFGGKDPKKGPKPKKGRKPRNPRARQGRGGSSPGGGSGSGGSPSTRRAPGSGGGGGDDGRNLRNGGGDPFGYRNPVDRGRRDTIGKSLPSIIATREAWEAEAKGDNLYFFAGRNTGIAAPDANEARRRKRRGGDRIVATRTPDASERRAMRRGDWVRTRRDGKTPDQSQYGRGRGHGPPRKG